PENVVPGRRQFGIVERRDREVDRVWLEFVADSQGRAAIATKCPLGKVGENEWPHTIAALDVGEIFAFDAGEHHSGRSGEALAGGAMAPGRGERLALKLVSHLPAGAPAGDRHRMSFN